MDLEFKNLEIILCFGFILFVILNKLKKKFLLYLMDFIVLLKINLNWLFGIHCITKQNMIDDDWEFKIISIVFFLNKSLFENN